MANESKIKEELLKQMARNPDTDKKLRRGIIERDLAGVRRLKWITIFSWLLVIPCFWASTVWDNHRLIGSLLPNEQDLLEKLTMMFQPMLLIAIIFCVLLYNRSRTLTIHKIQARLVNIEMLLKEMSQDK